ncbi:MAG TPA: lipocalin-like domain-containing protein [Candidatus Angelobacter sp.]|nr:lipocalin-like domain-containing protein [Candidatus Angelobacter sp.]
MKCKYLLLLLVLWAGTLAATSQSGSIVGTWALTAADKLLPDGTRTSDFGDNPHGLVIFTADGHYTVEIYRADRTKFSSDDRFKGTPDEYKEAFLGMSVHFGRYTVDPDKHTIRFIIDRASFPNWDDATQVRSYELKGDELSWKVPARPDGSIPITVLRRVR